MLPLNYIIQTPNFRLRIPDESDFDFVFSASRYPGFNDGMLWDPPVDRSELIAPLERSRKAWMDGTAFNFTIETNGENPARLGRITIRVDGGEGIWNVGFWTHPEHQGKGVMTEALAAILAFGFQELGAARISARYAVWNKASEKVLINNRLAFSMYIEKGFQKNGNWVSENEMVITAAAWKDQAQIKNKR